MLVKQYNYIKSCINDRGQIVDKKLDSPLEFQYHYASFILSSILMNDDICIEKVLPYYLSLPYEKMTPSNDFNVFLLLLALDCDTNNLLAQNKNKILESIYHQSDEKLYKLNNNFRALRLVGLVLEDFISSVDKHEQKISQEIDWILDLQFDDGFFPDSNMQYNVEKNRGVPHLTYHAKITMCLGVSYKYTQDIRLLKAFNRAIKVLIDISVENYFFFYGRSTNALFGYGSFYLVLMLAHNFSQDQKYLKLADSICSYLENFQHQDGHISINLNLDDTQRYGFDGYMYDIVYNAYSNAMFLYAESLRKNIQNNECSEQENNKNYGINIYRDSGFVVYQDEFIKYCFNYKGHQDSLKHMFDSRVAPLSILYFQKDKLNLLPGMGYRPSELMSLVERKFYFRRLYAKYYQIRYFDWIPLLSGNGFFYIKDKIKFYPFECQKMLKIKNKLILKFKAKARTLFNKADLYDKFVLSVNLMRKPEYNIIFYEEVDYLFYTYREIAEKKYFKYEFSHPYQKMKKLKVETSYQVADLYRYMFKQIKKLNIKVSINDD
jgi:hypothetical protein